METICLKMEKKLLDDIDSALKKNRYSTRTEFIRDAIRTKLNELEKKEIFRKLEAMKGVLKGKARRNDEEAVREEVVREVANEHGISLD